MYKRFILILVVLMLAFSSVPAMAAGLPSAYQQETASTSAPVIYEDTITVTEKGGRFEVGFVTLEFKKKFLELDRLPATFTVQVYAKDGEVGVEINPSTEGFAKNVHIRVDAYEGLLYDKELGQNIEVDIKNQHILARHFSWFRFR